MNKCPECGAEVDVVVMWGEPFYECTMTEMILGPAEDVSLEEEMPYDPEGEIDEV